MRKQYVTIAVLSTLLLPQAATAVESEVSGGVKLGIRGVDENSKSAKFQEYRDVDDGVFGKIWIDALKGSYFFDVKGKNIGQDNQSYKLSGGRYGQYKYTFIYDETPHNYAFDAKTPYSGTGSNMLSYSGAAPPAVGNWTNLDFSIQRKKYGGEIKASIGGPFYLNVDVDRQESKGVRPLFISDRNAEGVEIPEPIDHNTDNVSIRAGYASENYLVEISGMVSSFENEYSYVSREDMLAAGTMNFAGLAPDNDYKKFGLKFSMRHLPLASTFAAGASYATLENNLIINPELLAANPLYTSTFSGDISYTNFSAALSSRPMKNLNTRLYFNHTGKDNDASAVSTDDVNTYEKFEFKKDKFGVEANYRLPKKTKLTGGYEYTNMDRDDRPEFDETTDHLFTVKLRNSMLDFMSVKLLYQHLARDYETDNAALINLANPPDPTTYIKVSDFDANGKDMDEIKLGVEIYPFETIDFGVEYTYTSNDYDTPITAEADTPLDGLEDPGIRARQEDDSNSVYLDVLWRLPMRSTLSGFAGYETRNVESRIQNSTVPYIQEVDDDLWAYGLTGKMPLMGNKLELILDWEYQKSDGDSDFGLNTSLQSIKSVADYTKKQLKAKAVYAFTEELDFILGYKYEKYEYNDFAYEGFINDTTALLTTDFFFSGAYVNPDYETNTGYLIVKYGF